jgi:hypothetical protein
MINIRFSNRQLKKLETALGDSKKQLGKMAARAINKTATKHKTQISKKLREYVKINAKTAKESLKIPRKALEPNRLTATVVVNQTKKIGLNRFGAKQNKKGVRYQISKAEKGFIKGGFIVKKLGGHVFERANKYVPAQRPSINASKAERSAIRQKNKAQRKLNRQITSPKRGTTMFNVYESHKLEKWSKKETAKELKFQLDQQIKYALEKQGK